MSIPTPILESSQFRPLALKSGLFRPHTTTKVYFDVNTKTLSYSASVISRDIHTGTCSCDTAATRIAQIGVPTRIILDVSILK